MPLYLLALVADLTNVALTAVSLVEREMQKGLLSVSLCLLVLLYLFGVYVLMLVFLIEFVTGGLR